MRFLLLFLIPFIALAQEAPQRIAKVRVVNIVPNAPMEKRLAVYDPNFWKYPYRDWNVVQIPEGEAWQGWYQATFTGYADVTIEYTCVYKYLGLELSADLKTWYSPMCIDHFYDTTDVVYTDGKFDPEKSVRRKKLRVIIVADSQGQTKRLFARLNGPFVGEQYDIKNFDGAQQ